MHLTTNVVDALRSLRASPLRSALTMLGIAIGVGSVMLLLALGEGVERDIRGEVQRIGANLVIVLPGRLTEEGMPSMVALAAASTLTEQDTVALRAAPGVVDVIPLMFVAGSIERGGVSHPALVAGCSERIFTVRPTPLAEGRFYTEAEANEPVCVLGAGPRGTLFGEGAAIGQTVSVRGKALRVVGVLRREPQSLTAMMSLSNVVSVPRGVTLRAFPEAQVNRILLKTEYEKDPTPLLNAVRRILRERHGGREDFAVLTQEQLLGVIFRVFAVVTTLLAGISAVSLIVAGVGVMNIMLVTVTERTREIGIRKAVGARRRDVFVQFLSEAVTICVLGGSAGVAIAAAVCAVVAARTPLAPIVSVRGFAMSTGVCIATGLVFGVLPAIRAARQSPIDALRHE